MAGETPRNSLMDTKSKRPDKRTEHKIFQAGELVIGCGAGIWWPARIEESAAAGVAAGEQPSHYESCAAAQRWNTTPVKSYLLRFSYRDDDDECCMFEMTFFVPYLHSVILCSLGFNRGGAAA